MIGIEADSAWVADCVRDFRKRSNNLEFRQRLAGFIREPQDPHKEEKPKKYHSNHKSEYKGIRSKKRIKINNRIVPILPAFASTESRTQEEHNHIVNNSIGFFPENFADDKGSGETPDKVGIYLVLHAISQINPGVTRPDCPYIEGMSLYPRHSHTKGRRAVAI